MILTDCRSGGFPGGTGGEGPTDNAGDRRGVGSTLGEEDALGVGRAVPSSVLAQGHGQRSLDRGAYGP